MDNSIIIDFISTFFGVLLAFGITFFYDRWIKNKKEKQEKRDALLSIRDELESNLKHLSCDSNPNMAKLIRFNKLALESSVQTGIFSMFSIEIQKGLSEIHRTYQYTEMWVDKIMSLRNKLDDNVDEHFKENVINSEKALCRDIPKTISKINEELNLPGYESKNLKILSNDLVNKRLE